ncbi:hypothetical protein ACTID9_15195 [Brevibacillus fluminis]|uniref:hypothetical protein n=1 Tax=Brevibacillus fluminis TaxID=511487 RepID=UPI003F8C2B14
MIEQTLELRGIPLPHLITYLMECGGQKPGDETLPATVEGEGWLAVVLREETVTITKRFHVNAVFISFQADDEAILANLLARFKVKVTRVGG